MRTGKIVLIMFAVAVFVSLLAGVDCVADTKGFDDKEIRIAQWGPQTGPAAIWGGGSRGSKIRFDMVNEQGGIHGRKIKFFIRDDKYNPAETKIVVKELVERYGIFAFNGGVGTAGGMAVKDYLVEKKIPWVGICCGMRDFSIPVNKYRFNDYPLFYDDASVLTQYIVEKMGAKKIALLYQNDGYGKEGLNGCKSRLAKYKMELLEELPLEPKEQDLSSQMLKLKSCGADFVISFVNPTHVIVALKTGAKIGYKPQWVFTTALSSFNLLMEVTGGLMEGVIAAAFVQPAESDHPLMVKYHEAQKRLAPEEKWEFYTIAGMYFADTCIEGLKRAGRDLTTEKFIAALESIKDFQTIGGKISYSSRRHQGASSYMIVRCTKDGKAELLQDWTENDLADWKK